MMISDDYETLIRICIEEAIKIKIPILVASKRVKEDFKIALEDMGFEEKDVVINVLCETELNNIIQYLIFDPVNMITQIFGVGSEKIFYYAY